MLVIRWGPLAFFFCCVHFLDLAVTEPDRYPTVSSTPLCKSTFTAWQRGPREDYFAIADSLSTLTYSSAFGDVAMMRVEGGTLQGKWTSFQITKAPTTRVKSRLRRDEANLISLDRSVGVAFPMRKLANVEESATVQRLQSHLNSLGPELISFADVARLHFVISTHAETVALTFQLFFVFHESLMIVAYCEDWRGRQR